ncbi:MAG: DUF4349 domain-containing protein [Patescibacteria group bacterium]
MKKHNPPVYQRIVGWLKSHKKLSVLLSVIGAILILILGWLFLNLLSVQLGTSDSTQSPETSYDSLGASENDYSESYNKTQTSSGGASSGAEVDTEEIPGIKIIEAYANIETNNATEKEEKITSLSKSYDGYLEQSQLSETKSSVRVRMTLRVPADNFEEFFKKLRDSSEVENFNVKDYRIDIERRETQLSTTRETIKMYDEMIEETRQMGMNDDRINLTKRLTDQKMQLVKQENDLIDSISQSKRKSNYSTISLTIKQDIIPRVWPEDITKDFRKNLHDSFEDIAEMITSAFGNMLALFTTVIIWILYVIVAVLPVWIAYRLLRRSYTFFYRNKEENEK